MGQRGCKGAGRKRGRRIAALHMTGNSWLGAPLRCLLAGARPSSGAGRRICASAALRSSSIDSFVVMIGACTAAHCSRALLLNNRGWVCAVVCAAEGVRTECSD